METAVIIILLIITIAASVRLYLYRKEINSVQKQIKFIYEENTNKKITVNLKDKKVVTFANQLNDLLEKYRYMQIEADKKSRMIKNDFTCLSHDIRTPLTAIAGYFQLLCDSKDNKEREKYAAVISERIRSLESILESIFTYSKLQNEEYVIKMGRIDINELVTNVTLSFYEDIEKKGIEPQIEYADMPLWVWGNDEAYIRIFQNILINAIRHGNSSLEIILRQEGRQIHFYCKNDVNNYDEIDVSQVFNQFYKSDINRTHTSTGLGLSISKMLCEKMGVEIEAQIVNNLYFMIHMVVNSCD